MFGNALKMNIRKLPEMYRCFFKRVVDLCVSVPGFIILSPVFFVVTVLLFTINRGKPFFLQRRPGKNGTIFCIVKFKTMNDRKDEHGNLLPDARRMTAAGRFIRKTSLDEIPQLLNVIKGDMSLVGPRPLLPEYLPLYSDGQKRRHEVRPGITGWAQINGRNAISWNEKFELDVWYVDNISFKTDLKIFVRTLRKVIVREGINAGQDIPMEPFKGNN